MADHVDAPPELMPSEKRAIAQGLHPDTMIGLYSTSRGTRLEARLIIETPTQATAAQEALAIMCAAREAGDG